MKILVAMVAFLFVCAQVVGCVIGEAPKKIRPADTTWIQNGQTTRAQIEEKFGKPQFSGTHQGVGQHVEYTYSPPSSMGLEPRPSGPFPQAYQPPARTMPQAQAARERFWVTYDAQGIVQDFGFGSQQR